MTITRAALLLATLILSAFPVAGSDLAKIDRHIKKEPAYQGKPKYGLLVFGPEAKTCVWLILDGDVLYADKNGNGDLTEKGERITDRCIKAVKFFNCSPASERLRKQ